MELNKKSELAKAVSDRKVKAAYCEGVKDLILEILIEMAVIAIIFSFIFGIHINHGNDMYPAIKDGDIVLYYRQGEIVNTETVVYETPEDGMRVGRVVAQSGTEVSVTGDLQMTFDGIYLPVSKDEGIYSRTYAYENAHFPFTIEEDGMYILGDNRDVAKDSRQFGQIHKRNVKGRVISILRRRQI